MNLKSTVLQEDYFFFDEANILRAKILTTEARNSHYIADANNHLVRIFELDKKVLRTMAIEE
jgi:hypothetical protein